LLTTHRDAVSKEGGCWSPAAYRPHQKRGNAGVEAITLVVLDFDHCIPDWSLLGGLEYVASTTHSHTAEDPHWRVVLLRAVPVPANDWPSCPPGAARRAFRHRGRILDWRDLKPVPQANADDDLIGVVANGGGPRPGDRYADETDWADILEPQGWELVRANGAVRFWRCPASDKPRGGHCATTGHGEKDSLFVFCNAEGTPFEGQTPYTKFGAYAALEHGGDHSQAARALAERYGMARQRSVDPQAALAAARSFMRTDLGNAERLVARHGRVVRYCQASKKWLVYDGRRWRTDAVAEVWRLAKDTVRHIYTEASLADSEEERQKIAKWAVKSESGAHLKAMLSLAEKEVGVPVAPEDLDADPWLLNVANGTLDLRTRELRAHRPEDLLTKLAPVAYDPDATCPTWMSFLHRIMGAKQALIDVLQRAVGYALTGSTREQVLFLLYGTGANGKSTCLDALQAMLADYAQQADFTTLLAKEHESVRNDLARLRGARFVAAVEAEAGKRLSEVVVKQLTGGDRVTARFLYGEFFEFTPTLTLFLAANHKPEIRGQDNGMWRRMRLIPFTVTIPPDEQDRELTNKLRDELPGIFAWAVQGCLAWLRYGLGEPDEVREATAEYKTEMDILGDFLAVHAEIDPVASVAANELYVRYLRWAEHSGEKGMSKTMLGHRLTERGFTQRKVGKARTRGWGGLRLLPDPTLQDSDDGAGADTSGQADVSEGVFAKPLQYFPGAMSLSK
jgi:putative DNA primase/helicase